MKQKNIKDTINEKGTFDLLHYNDNINDQNIYIKKKIQECEIKISSLKNKEKIINNIITRISDDLDKTVDNNNHKLVNINQQKILTFFETLSIIQEMLIKYEDMIQKYIKMSIDIENHKINAFVKIKTISKNDDQDNNQYGKLMEAFNTIMESPKQENVALNNQVMQELKLEGY